MTGVILALIFLLCAYCESHPQNRKEVEFDTFIEMLKNDDVIHHGLYAGDGEILFYDSEGTPYTTYYDDKPKEK